MQFWSKPERPPREECCGRLKDKSAGVPADGKIGDEVLRAARCAWLAINVA